MDLDFNQITAVLISDGHREERPGVVIATWWWSGSCKLLPLFWNWTLPLVWNAEPQLFWLGAAPCMPAHAKTAPVENNNNTKKRCCVSASFIRKVSHLSCPECIHAHRCFPEPQHGRPPPSKAAYESSWWRKICTAALLLLAPPLPSSSHLSPLLTFSGGLWFLEGIDCIKTRFLSISVVTETMVRTGLSRHFRRRKVTFLHFFFQFFYSNEFMGLAATRAIIW